MMTLESAIKHYEEVAEEQEELYGLCPASESDIYHCDGTRDCRTLKNGKNKGCIKCAEEHRQLAEWLKESKHLCNLVSFAEYHNVSIKRAKEELLRHEVKK